MTFVGLLGVALLCAAGLGAGYFKAAVLSRRLELLINFRRMMASVLERMLFFKTELKYIYSSLQKDPELAFLAEIMADEQRGAQALDGLSALTERDKQLLREFSRGIGMGDLGSQKRRAEMIDRELLGQIESAKEELRIKRRLYVSLGASLGLCVGIILV